MKSTAQIARDETIRSMRRWWETGETSEDFEELQRRRIAQWNRLKRRHYHPARVFWSYVAPVIGFVVAAIVAYRWF